MLENTGITEIPTKGKMNQNYSKDVDVLDLLRAIPMAIDDKVSPKFRDFTVLDNIKTIPIRKNQGIK